MYLDEPLEKFKREFVSLEFFKSFRSFCDEPLKSEKYIHVHLVHR